MKTQVKALVVGGGAVGTSIAYHLAKAGWDDVMLVERDEQLMIAEPDLAIEPDDLVSILGEPNDLSLLYDPTYLD